MAFLRVFVAKSGGDTLAVTASQIIADLGLWRVHQPHVADILNAIDLQQRYALSFWDAIIIQSALALDCSVLWSEDLNHLQIYHQIQVRNPFFET